MIIVATPEHTELVLARLEEMEVDPAAHREAGELILLEAAATLSQFMQDGMPDWTLFRRAVMSVLDRLCVQPGGATRAYGEMVSLLWQQGNSRAAIRLEEFWNEICRSRPLTLFCGYMLDGLEASTYQGPVNEIGRTHTDVLPTDDDERLRAVIDAASEEVLGISFSLMLTFSGREQAIGEHRLPLGRRTMLWLQRNMPGSSGVILERARYLYQQGHRRLQRPPLRLTE